MWNIPSEKRLAKLPNNVDDDVGTLSMDKIVYLHFFMGSSDWYAIEYDPRTEQFFGCVILNNDREMAEFGYFSFNELKELKMGFMEVDCERAKYWKPQKIRDIRNLKHLLSIYES